MTLYRVGAQMRIEHDPFVLHGIVTRIGFDSINVRVVENSIEYEFDTSRLQPTCVIDGRVYKAREIKRSHAWTQIPLSRCCIV